MLVPALLALAASSTVSEVELTPTLVPEPLVVAPAPTGEEVSRADAARVERWLESLAGFERDQRRTAGIVALGGGAGLVLAGGLVLADSTIDDRTTRGPALLGAGGALLATGVIIYLITGKAEDLAAELAAADLEDPVRRAQAIRTTEAQVVELAQEYRSTRTLNGVVLLAAGAASLVLSGVVAADTTRGDDAYLPPIVGGTGVAAVGLGVYMLTVGRGQRQLLERRIAWNARCDAHLRPTPGGLVSALLAIAGLLRSASSSRARLGSQLCVSLGRPSDSAL